MQCEGCGKPGGDLMDEAALCEMCTDVEPLPKYSPGRSVQFLHDHPALTDTHAPLTTELNPEIVRALRQGIGT